MTTAWQMLQSFQRPVMRPPSAGSLAAGHLPEQPEPLQANTAFRRVPSYESHWEAARGPSPEEFQRALSEEYRTTLAAIEVLIRRFLEHEGRLDRGISEQMDLEPSVPLQRLGETSSGLEEVYVFDDRSRVTEFIERNRLRNLLLQARAPLMDAFGETAIKRLSVLEDDEGSETLVCLTGMSGSVDEARLALRSFDRYWWLAHCGRAGGKLNFDFDLI